METKDLLMEIARWIAAEANKQSRRHEFTVLTVTTWPEYDMGHTYRVGIQMEVRPRA